MGIEHRKPQNEREITEKILEGVQNISQRDFLHELHQTYSTILKDDRFADWETGSDEISEEDPLLRLEYGSKVLFVNPGQDEEGNDTFKLSVIKKLDAENRPLPDKPDETKLVFTAARDLMQNRVNKSGKPATYNFWSENPAMIAWAQKGGREVFDWEENEKPTTDAKGNITQLACSKQFNPESSK